VHTSSSGFFVARIGVWDRAGERDLEVVFWSGNGGDIQSSFLMCFGDWDRGKGLEVDLLLFPFLLCDGDGVRGALPFPFSRHPGPGLEECPSSISTACASPSPNGRRESGERLLPEGDHEGDRKGEGEGRRPLRPDEDEGGGEGEGEGV
jgi:hypothetical protein